MWADPVVASLNDLDAEARATYLLDMTRLGNSEPELHCHIFPRYASEPDDKLRMPAW